MEYYVGSYVSKYSAVVLAEAPQAREANPWPKYVSSPVKMSRSSFQVEGIQLDYLTPGGLLASLGDGAVPIWWPQ